MNKNEDVEIMVKLKFEDERAIFTLGFPSNKQRLTLHETAHTLTGAVAMLIRSVDSSRDKTSGHELMREIVEHLESEFINPDSFEDSVVRRENVAAQGEELSYNQVEAIKKIQGSNTMDMFQKQFEIAKTLGRIDESVKYSDKMSLKEYQKFLNKKAK
jgi:hypothetical protein